MGSKVISSLLIFSEWFGIYYHANSPQHESYSLLRCLHLLLFNNSAVQICNFVPRIMQKFPLTLWNFTNADVL